MALGLEGLIFAYAIGPWLKEHNSFDATQGLQFAAAAATLMAIGAYWMTKLALRYLYPEL
jgi:hypothetical protein